MRFADTTTTLSIKASPSTYTLKLAIDAGGSEDHSFDIATQALTVAPPVGGAFCGTMFGIYSFGEGEPVLDAADFSEIKIV